MRFLQVRQWHRFGFHSFHGSRESISFREPLGRSLLSHVIYTGPGFPIWNSSGSNSMRHRPQDLSKSSQRTPYRYNHELEETLAEVRLYIIKNNLPTFFSHQALICGLGLVLSLVFCHGAGNYIFTLFDNFAGSVPLLIIALSECIAIAYVYGLKR